MHRGLAGLCALAAVDHVTGYAVVVFGPELARGLGVGLGTVAAVGLLRVVGYSGAVSRAVAAEPATIARAGGLVAGASLLLAGLAPGVLWLAAAVFLYGAASVAGPVAHQALLSDAGDRVRFLHRAAVRLGNVAVPLALGAIAVLTGGHWRPVFVVAGAGALAVAGLSSRLLVTNRRMATVRDQASIGGSPALVALTVASVCELPLYICAFGFLAEDLGLGGGGRALAAAGLEFAGVAANVVAIGVLRRRGGLGGARTAPAAAVSVWIGVAAIATAAWIGTGVAALVFLLVGALAGAALVPLLLTVTVAATGPAGAVVRRTALVTLAVATPALVAVGPRAGLVLLTLPGGIGALLATRGGTLLSTGARMDRAERALLRRPLT